MNNTPNLREECEIVQNATDLCRAPGIERPIIELLSAMETVSSKLKSTKDAAALCLPIRADGAAARTGALEQIFVDWRSAKG